MKRFVSSLIILSVVTMSLWAFDWGGSLTNSTSIQGIAEGSDENLVAQTNRLTLYLGTDLWRENVLTLQGAALLAQDPVFSADIEKAYLSRTVYPASGNLRTYQRRIGRFLVSDPTSQVLRQVIDGVSFSFDYENATITLTGGYTGFLLKEFAGLSMSKLDGLDDADEDVLFAPGRAIGQITYQRPEILFGQNLTVAAVIQEDVRDPASTIEEGTPVSSETAESGGLVDTQYGIVRLNGPLPIIPNFYYDASYVLNTGRMLTAVDDPDFGSVLRYEPIQAHMVRMGAQFYMPGLMNSRAAASVSWSSGDADFSSYIESNTVGKATQFLAVNPSGSGSVFGLQPGNSMTTAVSFSAQPLQELGIDFLKNTQTEVTMYQFFRSAGEGPVSSADVDAAASGSYLGTEFDAAARFRPLSDLGFGVSAGLFMANSDILVADARSVDFLIRLDASLSF